MIVPFPPSSAALFLIDNPYVASNTSLGIRLTTKAVGPVCSLNWSIGSTPSQTRSARVVANCGNTRPGQSHSTIVGESWMVWKCFVLPGVDDTLTFFSPIREFIVLDFPTLGYPTRPITSFVACWPADSVKSNTGKARKAVHAHIVTTYSIGLVQLERIGPLTLKRTVLLPGDHGHLHYRLQRIEGA